MIYVTLVYICSSQVMIGGWDSKLGQLVSGDQQYLHCIDILVLARVNIQIRGTARVIISKTNHVIGLEDMSI